MDTQIQFKINNEEKELIEKASKLLTLGFSTFSRMAALEKAREILNKNSKQIEAN